MGAIGDLIGWIATPLYYAISGVLVLWHKLFSLVLPENGGWSWVLAIIGLTVTIRALLIPLFVKQIKSSRNMQLLQPKVKELQKKYGHDRQRLSEETMKLYKESGTNPFASCMPLILQMPIFFTLLRILEHAAKGESKGFVSHAMAGKFAAATWLGSPISSQFTDPAVHTKILAGVLVVAMIATTFTTQRQLMAKNMPPSAMEGQYAKQQKMMLYVLPVVFAVGGIAFPIGVLVYWTISNLWTMCQQFYVIRNNPVPGTPAYKAKQERDRAKAAAHGRNVPAVAGDSAAPPAEAEERRAPQRAQPKRQTRSQRQTKSKAPGQAGGATSKKKGGGKK